MDHKDSQFAERLAEACPNGVDVNFENVGGAVFDTIFPLLNVHSRVVVCGTIATYNEEGPARRLDRLPHVLSMVLQKRIKMQGLIILDHDATRFEAFRRDMRDWVRSGKVRLREHVVDGLENAPAAFIGMLQGRNFGKLVVRVSEE